MARAAQMKLTPMLTNNGKAFTDLLCAELENEHCLPTPLRRETNGTDERFNGRIEKLLERHRSQNGEDLKQTIPRYVTLYNQEPPQSALA